MSFHDKTVTCTDCGFTFTFSAVDQEYFNSHGYFSDPRRCSRCKEANQTHSRKKAAISVKREVFTVTCVRCGRDTSVPANSHTVSAMYCTDCSPETGLPVILDPGQEVG
jgi:CxxC-x17-CxxC domain-containing protein